MEKDVRNKWLLAGGGVLVLLVLVFAYLGFIPGLSDLFGTNKPRDLGVRYTETDYQTGLAKIPGHTPINIEFVCVTCPYESRGSVPVDATFTQEEFTAQLNKMNSEKGPLRNVQVKFNADGTIETSGMITDPALTAPIYAKGKIVSLGSHNVQMDISELHIGQINVGPEQVEQVQGIFDGVFTDFFAQNPGLSVESLQVQEGQVYFNGTFPEEVEGDPNAVPQTFS